MHVPSNALGMSWRRTSTAQSALVRLLVTAAALGEGSACTRLPFSSFRTRRNLSRWRCPTATSRSPHNGSPAPQLHGSAAFAAKHPRSCAFLWSLFVRRDRLDLHRCLLDEPRGASNEIRIAATDADSFFLAEWNIQCYRIETRVCSH